MIAWEMLARKRLYRERNDTSVLLQLISEPPVRLRTVRPEVPQPLEDAVAHALATAVEHRCPTAKELADALEARFGLLTRSGLHCAPAAHTCLGTSRRGGTTRLSFGPFLDEQDIKHVAAAISTLCVEAATASV